MGYRRNGRFIPWYTGRSGAFSGDALVTKAQIMHYRNVKRFLAIMEAAETQRDIDDAAARADAVHETAGLLHGAQTKHRVDYGAV